MELAINPNTIQRAYAELERQGYIYSVKGRGIFVAENHRILEQKKREVYQKLEALIQDARAAGITMLEFQDRVIELYGTLSRADREEGGGKEFD